jgi:hypothetical protein
MLKVSKTVTTPATKEAQVEMYLIESSMSAHLDPSGFFEARVLSLGRSTMSPVKGWRRRMAVSSSLWRRSRP